MTSRLLEACIGYQKPDIENDQSLLLLGWSHDGTNKTGNVRINVTMKRVRVTSYSEKLISMTYYVTVLVTLVIQHAKRMRRIVICGLSGFPTLSHKRHDFRGKKFIEHKMCVLIFSTTFAWNIFHSKNWARYKWL